MEGRQVNKMRRVVITGMGVISPIGKSVPEFWDSLSKGKSGAGPITRFDSSEVESKIVAEVKDFNPSDYMSKKESQKMALFTQYAVAAASEALTQSGLESDVNIPAERLGVILGNGIGGIDVGEASFEQLLKGGSKRMKPLTVPLMIPNEAAGNISMKFQAKAPTWTMVTACASGTDAIGFALDTIRTGRADALITGGTEACICNFTISGFCRLKALSTGYNDTPEIASRPFDKNRDGFVMGEGAGILVLEELEHAKARGAKILGEVAGYGASSDAFHLTAPNPDGSGAARAIKLALEDSNMNSSDVDYFNAHGTSTLINDVTETNAIKLALGEDAYRIAISSTKGMTGHCVGAAGGIEAIASVLAIQNSFIPPTINLDEADELCDLDYVPNVGRKAPVSVALSSSLGFGGHNAIIALKRYEK